MLFTSAILFNLPQLGSLITRKIRSIMDEYNEYNSVMDECISAGMEVLQMHAVLARERKNSLSEVKKNVSKRCTVNPDIDILIKAFSRDKVDKLLLIYELKKGCTQFFSSGIPLKPCKYLGVFMQGDDLLFFTYDSKPDFKKRLRKDIVPVERLEYWD